MRRLAPCPAGRVLAICLLAATLDARGGGFGSVAAAEGGEGLGDSFALEAHGDYRGALRVCRAAAEREPSRYFARVRVAYLELTLKNYAAAAEDYRRAAELAPRAIEALLGEQQALVALGRYAEAEPVGRAIVTRDPDNYLGTSRLAWTLFNLKRYAEAATLYSSLLSLYPGDLEMMTGLGYAELRAGRKREAADVFRVVLGISPNHARARAGLAACR